MMGDFIYPEIKRASEKDEEEEFEEIREYRQDFHTFLKVKF